MKIILAENHNGLSEYGSELSEEVRTALQPLHKVIDKAIQDGVNRIELIGYLYDEINLSVTTAFLRNAKNLRNSNG